ncbi:MAG TPA: pyrroloquinoline quinone biosynthesis peptide chaperone PqqD [Myxococcota bacterium]|nr:pyrroloquinoline quinone biosynthesis peptide chaperone PqqD [Myxococcota bacterium]
MSLTLACRPRLAPHARLHWDRFDERHMLLLPEAALVLDETATTILQLCDGVRTLDAVVTDLCRAYEAPREEIEADMLAFLGQLEGRGLLEAA